MLTHSTPLPPLHALHPLPSSLGWRPQNASFHTDKQYLRNHPDAVFDAAANGTYGELKGGYYRFPKPLKHMVDHPTSCFPCPPGSAQPKNGSSSCDLCRPGRYSLYNGTRDCLLVPVGFYQANWGATNYTECPTGKTTVWSPHIPIRRRCVRGGKRARGFVC